MKNLWGGVSGIIENNEQPLKRAIIEIFEEVGLAEHEINLLKEGKEMDIISPQYKNHIWHIFPFLFGVSNIELQLNWENSDFKWIQIEEIKKFETVPSLEKVLLTLI